VKFVTYLVNDSRMPTDALKICVAGENSLIVYLSTRTEPLIAAKLQRMTEALRDNLKSYLIDLIPSYASILVIYNPLLTDHFAVSKSIHAAAQLADKSDEGTLDAAGGALVKLPVYYGLESGPDLAGLAANAGLTVEQVIAIHQSVEYRVYAIGFAPGFAYLGEVDERIAASRLATPRQKVPKGAVAIADRQTAVYPAVSPGGWNLIGLCPTLMFDPNSEPNMPVKTGDRVVFEAIDRQAFIDLGGDLNCFEGQK
jgi:KipI family sensor histidine kinase inhibitor